MPGHSADETSYPRGFLAGDVPVLNEVVGQVEDLGPQGIKGLVDTGGDPCIVRPLVRALGPVA
ncbi:hypothetical protein [Streptomyces sp. NPDC012888]|uniref:hypothetical protein n=1 Tax=Streptomyces sp. NPDC012888 TaxID=3364855 RepID=UPI0036B57222